MMTTLDLRIRLAVGFGGRPVADGEEPSGAAAIDGYGTVPFISDTRYTHEVTWDRNTSLYRLALGGVYVGHADTEARGHAVLRAVTEAALEAMEREGLSWAEALEDAAVEAAEDADEARNMDYRKSA